MSLLTAVLAGVAFVAVPFLAIALLFELGVAIERLCCLGGNAFHWLASHFHAV